MSLLTRWGADLDPDAILPEYPRPQLARDSHLNLNGRWEYAITADEEEPGAYDGAILVPFSPESPLSGVGRQLLPGQTLWYRRALTAPDGFLPAGDVPVRVLLHFGAVDQTCRVLLNGAEVGAHTGGYLPFTCDITDALRDGENTLVVAVRDDSDTGHHARGKQKLKRGGIWYTAQSGIWQSVWAECVPAVHVERLTLTPHLGEGCVEVTVHAGTAGDARVEILAAGAAVARAVVPVGRPVRVPIPDVRPWSPEDPFLYDVTVELGADRVRSYVGMRSFSVGPDENGVPRLLLNGRPYFHAGILDQGYWSDGMYTAPSDEAMIYDIATMKRLGFTMLRKHIKIEPLRWYYHCDRLGMLVWQDMVNGGGDYHPLVITAPVLTPLRLSDRRHRWFGRADAQGRARFRAELRETVEHLRNVVSLAVWVPFNEGWGQFDAVRIAAEVAELDPTRTVDHASGWHDQGGGDLKSLHVYFRRFRVPRRRRGDRRVLVLSEYGGYNLRVDGHAFNDRDFGYRRYGSAGQLGEAFSRLHTEQIVPAVRRGLSATVYTQLSDVEDELNGLLTYDRETLKLPAELVRSVNALLRLE
ncbi:glycoside hydrolase family 2 protein [Streptosporangium roseum]|uniref:Beta-galactosidase n=1 Tax=Streptosporangium roseum (strain ATCC 12428 / DSM 43021 / JCM 3005 / KCTC 9067 / NCIMB 10171 / NRRL 2505 / NI 9100) TaxID=479432 RepID=D2BDH3_STRRD|nr:sugar-binding domain-containing protein [Streptosporangium roseum]ACZ86262.1 Beta-galactosidase [Streptosporangium roseum DSM 43021]